MRNISPRFNLFAMMALLSLSASAEDVKVGTSPQRPRILGISHIALYVHDLERSRAFYKDFLGFDEPFSIPNSDGTVHLAVIKINDRQSIELFPEKKAGTDRLAHIAIQTDDAEAMR